jgi:DNA polymerase-3 subunit epsilon
MWAQGPMVGFDTETTGTDVEADRVVTATVARVEPNAIPTVRSYLAAVEVEIPQAASDVHGITTEHARAHGKPPVEVLDAVAADLAGWCRDGTPIVGMNLTYDLTILDRELRRHRLPTLEARLGRPVGPVVDVWVIDKALDRFRRGGRRLADLCAHYGARLDGAHDATQDCLAAVRVAWLMCRRAGLSDDELVALYADRRYPGEVAAAWRRFGGLSLGELHEAQRVWFREQAEGLAAWWRQKAAEAEHQAGLGSGDREDLLAEAESLRARADGMSVDWPMVPFRAVVS